MDLINGKPGDCFVNVNIAYFKGYDLAGVDYGLFCQVVAHGVGHLLGFGHSTDPTNLMFPDATPRNMPAECKVAP